MAYGLTQSPLLVAATPSYFNTAANIAALDIVGDITIEAWVKFTSMPADRGTIVGKADNTGNAYGEYHFEVLKNGANYDLRCVMNVGGTATAMISFTSWNPNLSQWYHVAVTRTGNNFEIIVDGVSKATATTAGTITASTTGVYIGKFGSGVALDLDGRVSLVRVWNAQRSAGTINANKCVYFGSAQTNMQGEWSLDNVLTDSSGNASTLTNNGSVVFAVDTPSVCASTTTTLPFRSLLGVGI